jgi:hypothetical protein
METNNPLEAGEAIPDSPVAGQAVVVRGRKSDRIILALLEHSSVPKAAVSLGMSEATIWRRLKDPTFQDALREARREAFSRSIARLEQASSAAVTTLLRIMADGTKPAATRVRAAVSVLELAFRATELEDIQTRIRHIEEALQGNRAAGLQNF